MTRKLSTITTAKVAILSETTKQMKVKSRPRITRRRLQEFI